MSAKVLLLDGNSLLYRAFFALPPLTTSQGEMTNAVYGLAVMLNKILAEEEPDFVAAAFDLPAPTFRHEAYQEYKATRERAPDELRAQIETAKELLEALHIAIFQKEGYEADDLLGALARRAENQGYAALIVSGDLDVLQLVTDKVSALITRRGVTEILRYDPAAIQEHFGLNPAQLVDYKSLRGDVADNIPGVPGVGEKTATALLQQYGNLEEVLDRAAEIKPARAAAALQTFAEQAKLSKHLATIDTQVPVEADWEALRFQPPDASHLKSLYERLEFRGLLKQLANTDVEETPQTQLIQSAQEASRVAQEMRNCHHLTLALVAEAGSPHTAQALGVLLRADKNEICYLPARADWLAPFKPLLEDAGLQKAGHNLKEVSIHLGRLGIDLAGLEFDGEIASYLAYPLRKKHDLWEVAFDLLQTAAPEPLQANEATPQALAAYGALQIARIEAVRPELEKSLADQELERLFGEVEMPLVKILAEMETAGVSIDTNFLGEFSARLSDDIAKVEENIFILAGEEFSINSPKQLQQILYEKLGLKRGRRTKTGYSTDAAALTKLAEDYEIAARILEYRELSKLQSTYVDALPRLVNPRTDRIHPSFNQTGTITGRLSCSDPNLQNIPIRTELGREIRRAFVVADSSRRLFAADYSQIELRVLADIAQDKALQEIFAADEDLHTATAGELFDVKTDEVTYEMRRLAKIVNFSIPYGTTPEGLAARIEVSVPEAREYMSRYFERFAGVARYMEEIVAQARETGYVTTVLGRRRPLPEISSPNVRRRELAERMAINTPIQGSAADIMKLAMLAVDRALKEAKLSAEMILQVHDELVFEAPTEEIEKLASLVKQAMEGALQLCVPLKVEMESGENWRDMQPIE